MRAPRVAVTAAISMVLVACGVGACGVGAGGQPTSPGATTAPASTGAIASSSPTPPAATPGPSAGPTFSPAPAPQAALVTADATIPGTLGTYTIDDGGSDSPWLPFGSLPAVGIGAAERPDIRFVDGVEIGQFEAEIAGAADTSGTSTRGVTLGALAGDGRSFSIGPLPVGQWVLEARVFRADGRGDGITFWAVTVR